MTANDLSRPTRTDIDKWLLDVTQTFDQARLAWSHFENMNAVSDAEEHARRMAGDDDYAQVVDHLVAAGLQRDVDNVEDFIADHPEMTVLPARLRLEPKVLGHPIPPGRRAQRAVNDWAQRLKRAASDVHRAQELSRALQSLTGTSTDEEAANVAVDNTPLIKWKVFEDAIAEVEPSDVGIYRSIPERPFDLRILTSSLEYGRAHLARAYLQHSLETSHAPRARRVLDRLLFRESNYFAARDEPAIRDALRDLGFEPATDREGLRAQVRAATSADPEQIRAFLTHARATADRLKELTGEDTLKGAVRKARATLSANRPYVEEPRRGVIVYSGGLPTLGKRR